MKEKLHAHPLPVIFFTLFLNALGFGILIPVIPLLLADPRSSFFLSPSGWSLNQGFILLGFLTGIFPLMQFLATPILGQLSDRYGRKPLLLISLAGTSISYIIFEIGILSANLPLLFFSRALDGITGGNISVAQAAIADITDPEHRVKNFGLIGAGFGLGFILGPYLGGKLSDPAILPWFNAATPFLFAAILAFANVLSVLFFLNETNLHQRQNLSIRWNKSLLNIWQAYLMKKLRVLFLTNFLFISGFTFFTTFFSVFLIKRLGYSQGNIGDFFSYIGLWQVFTQAVITRNLAKYLKENQVLNVTFIGTGLALLLFMVVTHTWQLLLISPFFALFLGLSMANSTALISKSVTKEIQGEILGIAASVQALAQSIPAILTGFIAAAIATEAPILVSALLALIAGVVFWIWYQPRFNQSQESPKL